MVLVRKKLSKFEEDLQKLESEMKKLQVQYDSFFSGGRKRPPTDTEWRVQQTIKRMGETGGRMRYADRFRYNNLAQRYAKYAEVWRRRSGRMERGQSAFSDSKVARELDAQRLAEAEERHAAHFAGAARPKPGGEVHIGVGDANKEGEKVQELYRAMMDSRKKTGEGGQIDYQQFQRFVQQKTEQMKKKLGVDRVEYSIGVKDGKVSLKVKGG